MASMSMTANMEARNPRLFNEDFCVRSDRRFHLFSRLPIELRLKIWDTFLEENRILHIDIQAIDISDEADYDSEQDFDPEEDSGSEQDSQVIADFYTEKNHLGNIRSGMLYSLSLGDYHRESPLLQVNSEARAAALAFYRVHLPCWPAGDSPILYYNPEFDPLHVEITDSKRRKTPPELLADVFHDCIAYDPKGYRVLNLIVGDGERAATRLPRGMAPFHDYRAPADLI
jgi:hypothetical protein